MSAESRIDIRPLTPARLGDLLRFFDGPAFADNPDWADCYCWFPYHDPASGDFDERSAEANREALAAAVGSGLASGYLAYAGDTVVGWVNAGPLVRFPRQARLTVDVAGTASTPCFTVDPAWRGQGIARRLLAAAIDGARAAGMVRMEAAPMARPKTPAERYRGTVTLYAEAGYEQVADLPTGQTLMERKL
jgi:GNAT superfamily N-acetyltransferase